MRELWEEDQGPAHGQPRRAGGAHGMLPHSLSGGLPLLPPTGAELLQPPAVRAGFAERVMSRGERGAVQPPAAVGLQRGCGQGGAGQVPGETEGHCRAPSAPGRRTRLVLPPQSGRLKAANLWQAWKD